MRLWSLAVLMVGMAALAAPVAAEPATGDDDPPDTAVDLHAAMLGSGPPVRSGAAGTLAVGEEFGVYSFRPDARWVSFGPFDVAAAGFTQEWLRVNLAGRLMRDGEVSDDSLPYADAFTSYKLLYGPADDPHRHVFSLLHPSPWGTTISLPAEGLDRLTILVGSDVSGHEHVALVVAMSQSSSGVFELPFPSAFPGWMQGWTAGKDKVRLAEDHWGRGVQLAFWGFGTSFSSDHRRNVQVIDGRPRVQNVAGPGTLHLSASLEADGTALATTFLAYEATGAQTVALEWRTPAEVRWRDDLVGTWFMAMAIDGGKGSYTLDLDVTTVAEASRLVTFIHDLWALDAADVYPDLRERPPGSPLAAPGAPLVLAPGATVTAQPPQLVLAPGATVTAQPPPLVLALPVQG